MEEALKYVLEPVLRQVRNDVLEPVLRQVRKDVLKYALRQGDWYGSVF